MHEQRADALQLSVGKPVSLMQNGAIRPITRDPLTDVQIQGLLREIAAGDAAAQLGAVELEPFVYRAPSGEVRVERRGGTGAATVLRPTSPADATGSPPPPTPTSA